MANVTRRWFVTCGALLVTAAAADLEAPRAQPAPASAGPPDQVLDELRVGRPGGRRRGLGARGLKVGSGRRDQERATGHEPPPRDVRHRCPPVGRNLRASVDYPLII